MSAKLGVDITDGREEKFRRGGGFWVLRKEKEEVMTSIGVTMTHELMWVAGLIIPTPDHM